MEIRSSLAMVAEALARVRSLDMDAARAWIASADVLIVDLREGEEIDEGMIEGAVHVPRGLLEFVADPASPLYNPQFSEDRPILLYCAVGGRSALGAVTLMEMGYTDVAHLGCGIAGLGEEWD